MEDKKPKGFQPGQSGNPAGRKKGTPDHATKQIKQAYLDLVQNNLGSIQGWLESVAQRDPAKAFDMLMKLSPFVVPKLTEEINQAPVTFILPRGVELPKPQESDDITE